MDNIIDIENRLKQLERKNSVFKRVTVFISLFIVFGGLIGWQSAVQYFQTIETNKLVLKDANGKERAVLFVDEENNVKLKFYNSQNEQALALGTFSEGSFVNLIHNNVDVISLNNYSANGFIQIRHPNDKLAISLYNNQITGLAFSDTKDKLKLLMATSDTNDTEQYLFQKNGVKGSSLSARGMLEFYGNSESPKEPSMQLLSWDGFNQLVFKDGEKQLITLEAIKFFGSSQLRIDDFDEQNIVKIGRVIIDSNMNTSNKISLSNFKGKEIISLGVTTNDLGRISIMDSKENPRLVLGIPYGEKPSLSLFDKNGNLRTVIGSTNTENNRGQTISHPESCIWLFDENGKGLFTAPQE